MKLSIIINKFKRNLVFFFAILLFFESILFLSYYVQSSKRKNYYIFLGEWKITSLIPGGRFSDPSYAEHIIGSTISLTEEQIVVNENVCMEYPLYIVEVMPMQKRSMYYRDFGPIHDEDIFNLNDKWFVHVTLGDTIEKFNFDVSSNFWVANFYIKSENEIIFNGISHDTTNLYLANRIK